jgi:DNA-binding response OmpR family regulator
MSTDLPFALIVEDDPQVRILLCRMLASDDFQVSAVGSCLDAKQVIKGQKPDLVLLDLGLPGGDGLDLGKWIRSTVPSAGIIILTGRSDVRDRIAGLKNCADDYVTKPFDVEEVRARVHSLMRRLAAAAPADTPSTEQAIAFEGGVLREDNCSLSSKDREVKLTVMEFRLLKALVTRQDKVASREWLLNQIQAEVDINERAVDYHICTLRIKLRKAGLREDVITSVRGMGYKYSARPEGSIGGSNLP